MKKLFKRLSAFLLALAIFAPAIALAAGFEPTMFVTLGLPMADSTSIMENIIVWILGIVGFIAIIGFCISAIIYFVSAGDEDVTRRAKRAMRYSIVGVVVALMGYVIWIAAIAMLKGRSNF